APQANHDHHRSLGALLNDRVEAPRRRRARADALRLDPETAGWNGLTARHPVRRRRELARAQRRRAQRWPLRRRARTDLAAGSTLPRSARLRRTSRAPFFGRPLKQRAALRVRFKIARGLM